MTETYLAFDLGERHIGVAVSDPETGFVFPRPTIEVQTESEAITAIIDLVSALRPTAVIVGWPLSMSGQAGPQAAAIQGLVEKLKPQLPCALHLVDERLTTLEAQRHHRGDDHSQAARLILEKFLARSV